jgi:hypothetical protein
MTAAQPSTVLPPECIPALQNQPSSAAWQACGTMAWLHEFVDAHAAGFFNSTMLAKNGDFLGMFSLKFGFDMSCPFAQTCSGLPVWPPKNFSDTDQIHA